MFQKKYYKYLFSKLYRTRPKSPSQTFGKCLKVCNKDSKLFEVFPVINNSKHSRKQNWESRTADLFTLCYELEACSSTNMKSPRKMFMPPAHLSAVPSASSSVPFPLDIFGFCSTFWSSFVFELLFQFFKIFRYFPGMSLAVDRMSSSTWILGFQVFLCSREWVTQKVWMAAEVLELYGKKVGQFLNHLLFLELFYIKCHIIIF